MWKADTQLYLYILDDKIRFRFCLFETVTVLLQKQLSHTLFQKKMHVETWKAPPGFLILAHKLCKLVMGCFLHQLKKK